MGVGVGVGGKASQITGDRQFCMVLFCLSSFVNCTN